MFEILCFYHNLSTMLNFWTLKVTYHPLKSMNKFVTNKSKLTQDGVQVFPSMGLLAIM